MSFFGLTMLGGGEVFKEYSPNRPMVLAAVADDKYAEAFDMHKLGDTTIAEDCQVDGETHMLRGDLHLVLFHVLDRSPTAEELDVFLTFFDTDSSAVISVTEFERSIARLKGRAGNPLAPKTYISHRQYTDDMTKHRRVEYEPMTTLRRPVTTNQELGWHTQASVGTTKRFSLSTTDVTKNEGSQPSNYFGSCH